MSWQLTTFRRESGFGAVKLAKYPMEPPRVKSAPSRTCPFSIKAYLSTIGGVGGGAGGLGTLQSTFGQPLVNATPLTVAWRVWSPLSSCAWIASGTSKPNPCSGLGATWAATRSGRLRLASTVWKGAPPSSEKLTLTGGTPPPLLQEENARTTGLRVD